MIYGSVCSGIEAATVAWEPLGWKPSFYSEIDKSPILVLKHHYPDVPLHGDFTTIEENDYEPIDLLVGGTPCQSFSINGLRKGLSDERGNLSLEFIKLASRLNPRWVVWENVTGVLINDKGRAFGSFLGGLAECGYGFAYRVLDAQFFGVPQRRERVFVIGYLGDWRQAAKVLFEPESLHGHHKTDRSSQEMGRIAPTLTKLGYGSARSGEAFILCDDRRIRRLTPLEIERCFGFPDEYTNIGLLDSKRAECLGNSMAVPVMKWIGKRIQLVEDKLTGGQKAVPVSAKA